MFILKLPLKHKHINSLYLSGNIFLDVFVTTNYQYFFLTFITLAGFPPTISYGFTSLVTIDPVPTIAPFPILTPGNIVTRLPIQTSFQLLLVFLHYALEVSWEYRFYHTYDLWYRCIHLAPSLHHFLL